MPKLFPLLWLFLSEHLWSGGSPAENSLTCFTLLNTTQILLILKELLEFCRTIMTSARRMAALFWQWGCFYSSILSMILFIPNLSFSVWWQCTVARSLTIDSTGGEWGGSESPPCTTLVHIYKSSFCLNGSHLSWETRWRSEQCHICCGTTVRAN